MRRKQIYLDEASDRSLKRLAARTGRSEASHIRDALARYLDTQEASDADPLERMIGLVDTAAGPDDVAENHDRYLYGHDRT
jgi:predicted transcriptional regulator